MSLLARGVTRNFGLVTRSRPLFNTHRRRFSDVNWGEQKADVDVVGAKAGEVPTEHNQTTGRSHEEYMMAEQGYNRFNEGPLVGPFGTFDKPAQVLSAFDSRIVGCVGGATKNTHEVNWIEVKKGRKTICVLCGQFFECISVEGEGDIKPEEVIASNVDYYDDK